jgi:hypothetical protein
VFDGSKRLVVVSGSNRLFTSGVIGVYIILYLTAGILVVLLVVFASLLTKKQVLARRLANYLQSQKREPSDVRLRPAAKAT